MSKISEIDALLDASKKPPKASFYKTGPGDYAEHDQFLGVPNPVLRKIGKQFSNISLQEIKHLLESPYNEKRLIALFILIEQYEKGDSALKEKIFNFYKTHLHFVNNWNLVDSSAHLIFGAHLSQSNREELLTLAESEVMWQRRIAIVSTWYFIRKNDLSWTFKIADTLLNDKHDLIHKAVGWMLREAGKRNASLLKEFLEKKAHLMPRTMLRYSIEKFSLEERHYFMNLTG